MRYLLAIFVTATAVGTALTPGKATATPVPPRVKPAPPLPAAPPLIVEAPQLKVESVRVEMPRVDLVSRTAVEPEPEPAPVEPVPEPAIDAVVDHGVWDRLAECESGKWTHDGFVHGSAQWDASGWFDGGLQFESGTWSQYRSDDDPWVASDATREQQISVARKVLAKQGSGAWPTCSQWITLE